MHRKRKAWYKLKWLAELAEELRSLVFVKPLTVEDLMGILDAIAFPDTYRVAKEMLSFNFPMLLTGTMEMDTSRGEPYMKVERVVVIPSGKP